MTFNINNHYLYEGCGNRLLIVHLNSDFRKNDRRLRYKLHKLGLSKRIDSILVLTGDPNNLLNQGYHVTMDVFEPRGVDSEKHSRLGCWSTMCGNGVRAVTRYLIDQGKLNCVIKTGSGIRTVFVSPNNQFRVCMGTFTMKKRHLKKYVHNFRFMDLIPEKYINRVQTVIAGLNGDITENGDIDGEPHLVVYLNKKNISKSALIRLANELGKVITGNRDFFPECINSSIVAIFKRKKDELWVNACTFERGVEYVTQSCGTGATVIGSYLLSKNTSVLKINVSMPGGILTIERLIDKYYLTGSANPLL